MSVFFETKFGEPVDRAFFVVNIPASKEHVYDLSTFLSCFSE